MAADAFSERHMSQTGNRILARAELTLLSNEIQIVGEVLDVELHG
jgi:hypothetical protein